MDKIKKRLIIAGIAIAVLVLVVATYQFISNKIIRNQLPAMPQLSTAPSSLQEQIAEANKKAIRKPNSENIGMLGMVYHSSNYFNEAAKCYELASQTDADEWKWNHYLGYLKLELGDSKNAIAELEKVVDKNKKAFMSMYYLGEAYQSMDSVAQAEEILSKIALMSDRGFQITNTSRSSYFALPVYAKLQLAKLFANTNRTESAEAQLMDVIQQKITFGPAYRQLSNLYAQKGDSALSSYFSSRSKDLNIYGSPVDTLMDKVFILSRSDATILKQAEDAINSTNSRWAVELLEQGLKYLPNNQYIISKAIKQYIAIQAGEKALPYLEKHLQHFSGNYNELLEVGTKLAEAGYVAQATKYLKKAASFTDKEPEKCSTLAGLLYEKLGLKEDAIKLMNEVIDENPKNTTVLGDAVFLYLHTGENEKAKIYLNRLKQIAPNDSNVKIFEGIQAEKEGKQNRAIALFEAGFKANPKKKFVANHLSDIYFTNEMWPEAIVFLRSALKAYPNDSYFQERAAVLLVTCPDKKLRNIAEGREFAERAFINVVYNMQTRLLAGRTLSIASFQLNDRNKAKHYIKETIDLAQKTHAPKDFIAELEALSRQFSGNN